MFLCIAIFGSTIGAQAPTPTATPTELPTPEGAGIDICEIVDGGETKHTRKVPIIDVGSYTFKSAAIRPKDVVYGGLYGFNDISTNVERRSFLIGYPFGGVYYPKQVIVNAK